MNRQRRWISWSCVVLAACSALQSPPALAQRAAWHDEGFPFRRSVDLPGSAERAATIVSDFLTHGQLLPDGSNLVVYGRREIVPFRLLQVGPGDYCRVAFQPQPNQSSYRIYYGGEKRIPGNQHSKFTANYGLLLETRRWAKCDLKNLDSIRAAFDESEMIGSNFVEDVFHRHNPFDIRPAPFLSRYTGRMILEETATISFFTSSQDCSYLLIDGKVVVSAPGRHGPERRARIKGEVRLKKGAHQFQYVHAASGNECCMVAAWQLPGTNRPVRIPTSVFQSERITYLPASRLDHHSERLLPDFRLGIQGDVPWSDHHPALIRVQFADFSTKAVSLNAKHRWQFGDGQTSEMPNPGHIYLHPGEYQVTLLIRRGSSEKQITNRLYVGRSIITARDPQLDELGTYLETLKSYDASKLDPEGLVQLVRMYVQSDLPVEAVEAGKTAFTVSAPGPSDQTALSDKNRMELLRMIGPLMRFRLGEAELAARIYREAGSIFQRRDWRLECAVEAADVLLNDLLLADEAKRLLDLAGKPPPREPSQREPSQREPSLGMASTQLSKLHRVWADWHARQGAAAAAEAAYAEARQARQLAYSAAEADAWRGAYSRSCESFLRENDLYRLRQELQKWQDDFPADKLDGYWSFLQARYWLKREAYPQAIVLANDLLAVNPASPYADRMVYLSGFCEEARGSIPRAIAAYQSLTTDYPGSSLVKSAEDKLRVLRGDR